jgi:Lrp/AsnC family leucine-responsive transcriptional regulator
MTNDTEYGELEDLDRLILAELSLDGRMSVADLADKLGISKSPCRARVKRLVSDAVILGFRAVLDPQKTDQNHVAFVEIKLEDTSGTALKEFNAAVKNVPELEQCHLIAGSFDYLIKVRTKDLDACRQILIEFISELPHVASTATYFAMETIKEPGVESGAKQ